MKSAIWCGLVLLTYAAGFTAGIKRQEAIDFDFQQQLMQTVDEAQQVQADMYRRQLQHRVAFTTENGDAAHAHYRQHGAALLNDLNATPGVASNATAKQFCATSFHTGSVRNVPESVKHKACTLYGISPEQCTGEHYEIDHLISLELGGTNDLGNLWPQPYKVPGAKQKDEVENWLHRQVCAGTITLDQAQHEISTDWFAVWLTVPGASGGGAK